MADSGDTSGSIHFDSRPWNVPESLSTLPATVWDSVSDSIQCNVNKQRLQRRFNNSAVIQIHPILSKVGLTQFLWIQKKSITYSVVNLEKIKTITFDRQLDRQLLGTRWWFCFFKNAVVEYVWCWPAVGRYLCAVAKWAGQNLGQTSPALG